MARTIEQVLRDYLGDQVLMLARMTADMEKLREQLGAQKLPEAQVSPTVSVTPEPFHTSKPNGHG